MAAKPVPLPLIVDPSIPDTLYTERGFRPAWLLNIFEAHEWTVLNIEGKNPKTLVFNVNVSGGRTLADYPNLYDSIKRVAYGVRTGPLADIESADVQSLVVSNLTTLARWMIDRGIMRFSQLTKADREEYAAAAVYGADNILNSESILERHLEGLIAKGEFREDDEPDIRRIKALRVFPVQRKGSGGLNTIAFDRARLLQDAGLSRTGGVRGSVIASLLDEAEAMCGFYQPGVVKARAQKSRDDFDDKPVSEEHLRRFLMSFKYLYDHRRYLDDAPTNDPFLSSSPRAEARKLGSAVGRTGTVPVEQATHFIERSVRWVLDYAPTLLDLKDWVDATYDADPQGSASALGGHLASRRTWPAGPASPFPITPTRAKSIAGGQTDQILAESRRGGMALSTAMLSLMTACSVVIAAFTARRASEIVGLKFGCIHIDDSGDPWLQCFIHKTLRVESHIPIPEVVVAAIHVLERLSERGRHLTGTPYLFQCNVPGSDQTYGISKAKLPNFPVGRHLRNFGYFVDVPRMADGTPWTFKPHQFRRFFAILYIWVYDKADWGALQYHLRHFTSEMTRRYVTENEIGQIIAQADKSRTAEILANASMGLTRIGGNEGMRLQEIAQRLRTGLVKKTEVVSERKFRQRIERLIERTGLSLVAFPWGYCVQRKLHDVRSCNCTGTVQPDHLQASEVTCNGCECNMVTPSARSFLTAAIQFHRDVVNSSDSPTLIREASRIISQRLSETLSEISSPNSL